MNNENTTIDNENTTINSDLILVGRNTVLEALKAKRTIDKILILNGSREGSIKKIFNDAKLQNIVIQNVEKEKLDKLAGTGKHQGVIALAAAYDYVEVEDILKIAEEKQEAPFILILDNICDPHNLGAIIRTANIVGVHGIIIPKRRAVGLTSVVAKTAAGALEYTPVAKVTNLVQTMDKLKEKGIWIACADMDGEEMYKVDLKGSLAMVIGAEGEGVSRLIKEKCDFIASIPMKGDITSLNASVAAGVLMYEALRQRG